MIKIISKKRFKALQAELNQLKRENKALLNPNTETRDQLEFRRGVLLKAFKLADEKIRQMDAIKEKSLKFLGNRPKIKKR